MDDDTSSGAEHRAAAADSVCLFCSSDIRPSELTTTVPTLGVVVHTSCYEREQSF